MQLTFEQICSLTVGAVDIREEKDGIHFFKCTDKQSNAFKLLGERFYPRSLATTGIRLDFNTSSQHVKLCITGGKAEIMIDGMLRYMLTPNDDGEYILDTELCDSLNKKKDEYRVTVCLSSHNISVLKTLELDDGADFTRSRFDKKILFIGDSITQGCGTPIDTESFAWNVSKHFNAESVINGVGGVPHHITTFDKIPFTPDAVIIAYGTNDAMRWSKDPDEMQRQVSGFQELIGNEYKDSKIFVISPTWRRIKDGEGPVGEWFDARRKMIESEARSRGFIVVDGLQMIPPLREFYSDEAHPNSMGYSEYSLNLIRILEKYL